MRPVNKQKQQLSKIELQESIRISFQCSLRFKSDPGSWKSGRNVGFKHLPCPKNSSDWMETKILWSRYVIPSAISRALRVSIVSLDGLVGGESKTSRSTLFLFDSWSLVIMAKSWDAALCSAGNNVVLWTNSSRNSVVICMSLASLSKSWLCLLIQCLKTFSTLIVAAVEIIDSLFLRFPWGGKFFPMSAPTTDGSLLVPLDPGTEWLIMFIMTGLSGGLLEAAVATAKAEAAEAVDDLRADARLDVITTPALLDIAVWLSGNWKDERGVDKTVTSVWNDDLGVVDVEDSPPETNPVNNESVPGSLPLFPGLNELEEPDPEEADPALTLR